MKKIMRVALVHDYIKESGGAERVLAVLADMYPNAPIYTAFVDRKSLIATKLGNGRIRESGYGWILKVGRLYSPLRFLIPKIWRSFDLSQYDLVIASCSAYVARGFRKGKNTRVVAYCHTPPRWLYGYDTPTGYRNKWWGKIYAWIVNPFVRYFDFMSAQEVDQWVANSQNVRRRIAKFYRRDAKVVYPPVEIDAVEPERNMREDYHLIVSRLVGAKGIEEAVLIAEKLKVKLKVVGERYGLKNIERETIGRGGRYVEYVGRVSDSELAKLYAGAKSFWALAKDEDFGITVVEATLCGTPVVAYRGGGYLETVVEGITGVFVDHVSVDAMREALGRIRKGKWDEKEMKAHARTFTREEFERKIKSVIGMGNNSM